MKKAFITIIAMLIPLTITAQSKKSLIKLKDGTEIKGIIKAIDPTDAVTLVIGGIETKIKMNTISCIEDIDDNTSSSKESNSITNEPVNRQQAFVEDTLKNFKGFLLERGNNVYVYYSNTDNDNVLQYDKKGAEVIKVFLKADGFWNVVDDMKNAHFTINYCVDTHRQDKAILTISSWRCGKVQHLKGDSTNESIKENEEVAKRFYEKAIKPLQKKIEMGKLPKKWVEDFTIK